MIHHATRQIPPDRLNACVSFYALLGFRPVEPPPGIAGRATWLEDQGPPATQIHLMASDGAAPAPGHVAVICADYQATVERLREAGHDVEPRREHWGSPRSFVRDPAGHLVEIMAWPPPPSQAT
jgi:catechol 2,3-dioxygenase-like lactoylglutathione lyase family enzyme